MNLTKSGRNGEMSGGEKRVALCFPSEVQTELQVGGALCGVNKGKVDPILTQ